MDALAMFHGPNAGYALDLYDQYLRDPDSLDLQTRALFDTLSSLFAAETRNTNITSNGAAAPSAAVEAVVNAVRLARNIRGRGHLAAQLDPLGSEPMGDHDLVAENFGLHESDLATLPADIVGGPAAADAPNALEVINALRRVYQATSGYDCSHVYVAAERAWLREVVESGQFHAPLSAVEQRALLQRLTQVEAFERFLHQAFPGQKRFSIEGNDMLVPMLDEIIRAAALSHTHEVVIGMAHRGRLNVLAHVLGKPYTRMFAEFREAAIGMGPAPTEGINRGWSGDVKYHLGATGALREGDEGHVTLTLSSNPSHLEFINPVIEGMARAVQDRREGQGQPEQDDGAALPLLIHGDAAFAGEGVVAETLNLSRLAGYRTGGTIHLILNNQLGFTTSPQSARSTIFASDPAKGFEIPIIHVNADDPAACVAAARMAYAYRDRFRKDILIDLVGYRRWGHNEGDEPAFTQPVLYERIAKHPTVRALWARRLADEGIVTQAESEAMLEAALTSLREINRSQASAEALEDTAEQNGEDDVAPPSTIATAVPATVLEAYNEALLRWPPDFTPHPKLLRQLERRRAALGPEGSIDWAHAETLALASILADGTAIRMSGQDTERGTFSQRHLVLHDAATGRRYTPMQALPEARASFAIYNSPLSEAGALGFEYGYSVHAPSAMVIWEAQFGDFANAAQVIIDQFIMAARAKWRLHPSLTLLLPHGYEGQGPEHSSARLERYLQLAAHDFVHITNPTTAAQYFHLLRRQAALLTINPCPLVVMTPKSLLRHARASSRLPDLTRGSFQPVLDDAEASQHRDDVSRLVLCSGKVYVDLAGSEQRTETPAVAIARVEELYPFPEAPLRGLLASYPNLREVAWLQEEPKNMGAWSFMAPRLRALLAEGLPLSYIGRPERSSPAVGSARLHAIEQAKIVADAFAGVRALQRT